MRCHRRRHPRDFRGILQADAYGGRTALYDGCQVVEAACWAHARRPWWDPNEPHREGTGRLRRRCATSRGCMRSNWIFAAVHRRCDASGGMPGTGPLLEKFALWLQGVLTKVSTKSESAKAARYSLAPWRALTRYVDDGHIEIDNSAAERALRGVALGRGNYLFMGSNAGGERSASMYSLIETVKLNGLNPEAYLHEVLQRIVDHPANRIDELLRWSIAAQQALPRAA